MSWIEFEQLRRRMVVNHDTGDEDRATCCGRPITCTQFSGVGPNGFYRVTFIGCDVCEVTLYESEQMLIEAP